MGLLDYDTVGVARRPSATESARFGFSTERLTVGEESLAAAGSLPALAEAVNRELEASEARVVILRYPSRLVGLVRALEPGTARLYPAGALMYWEAPARPAAVTVEGVREVGTAERADLEDGMLAVLRDSFDGYVNHYSANPLIAEGLVVEGYAEWALSTVRDTGSRLFVATRDDRVVGVAVVAADGPTWEIELASIATQYQSRGIYLELIAGLLDAASAAGARVVISTQAHNIAVQRAWAKLGFRPIAAIDTVHVVRPAAASA